jgi:hypothetical protein
MKPADISGIKAVYMNDKVNGLAINSRIKNIIPTYKKTNKAECSNYRGTSLLSTSYKTLSNILLSRLSPYIYEIIGDHQSGSGHNKTTTIRFSTFVRY